MKMNRLIIALVALSISASINAAAAANEYTIKDSAFKEFVGQHGPTYLDVVTNLADLVLRRLPKRDHTYEFQYPLIYGTAIDVAERGVLTYPGTAIGRAFANAENNRDEKLLKSDELTVNDEYLDAFAKQIAQKPTHDGLSEWAPLLSDVDFDIIAAAIIKSRENWTANKDLQWKVYKTYEKFEKENKDRLLGLIHLYGTRLREKCIESGANCKPAKAAPAVKEQPKPVEAKPKIKLAAEPKTPIPPKDGPSHLLEAAELLSEKMSELAGSAAGDEGTRPVTPAGAGEVTPRPSTPATQDIKAKDKPFEPYKPAAAPAGHGR